MIIENFVFGLSFFCNRAINLYHKTVYVYYFCAFYNVFVLFGVGFKIFSRTFLQR